MSPDLRPALEEALEALRGLERFHPEEIESALRPIVERRDMKPKKLFQAIRVAITGTSVSPGIFESLSVLGKNRSVERIERAVERLSTEAADGNRS